MKPIGGYFELEISDGVEYHRDAIRLNTGRHALEYILRAKKYVKVYVPYYTCDVISEPMRRLDIEIEYFSIDKNFRPIFKFSKVKENEAFLYTNYFGICSKQVEEVISQCSNTIIDNAQSFFSHPIKGVDTFYSARKFFGVPDGAYLYTEKTIDIKFKQETALRRFEHLLQRIENTTIDGYQAFRENDLSFKNSDIKLMSKISQRILKSIDYQRIKQIRRDNFSTLQNNLNKSNLLKININDNEVPLAYPYFSNKVGLRANLIEQKIFIPQYWPNVLNDVASDSLEYNFTQNLLALPLDQRYGENEMKYIANLINDYE